MMCGEREEMLVDPGLIPGGFFTYKAQGEQEFVYVNQAMAEIAGCSTVDEFLALTGGTFRGLVYSEDLPGVEASIDRQISAHESNLDYVEYRIVHKSGSPKRIRDYGKLVETDEGPVFGVFISDVDDVDAYANHDLVASDSESTDGASTRRRQVLIVEDSELNREMLEAILGGEYEILSACDGQEGLEILQANYRTLSAVVLDVFMPVCTGFEFLERIQGNAVLSSVPVIVATGSDRPEDEAHCLELGAVDFVTKPYNSRVVLGRVRSAIRLHESVATLSAVEFDALTGVYTLQAFEHHAQRVLSLGSEPYDLVAINFRGFSMVNSVYGTKTGDEVLKHMAQSLREMRPKTIIARDGDCFYGLTPASERTTGADLEETANTILASAPVPNLSLKVGVYKDVDHDTPINILCDRAIMAAASIKDDYTATYALYSEVMEERQAEERRLEASFESALENEEFIAWIQPKVDVFTGKVAAAEALVRWIDSEGNFISPGAFVPLFERDGLIARLDQYMFKRVCRFQRAQLESGRPVVPISVNLSRNSMFRQGLVEAYCRIAESEHVPLSLVPIEITESAANEESFVLDICNSLVEAGFSLHMDDFGTGYSSISSLSTFPFSVLKLDKSMVDQIGMPKGDIVICNIVDTAKDLGMEVVAEGVEMPEQLDFLTAAGVDLIQGYLFSPPVIPEVFSKMLEDESPFKVSVSKVQTPDVNDVELSSAAFKRYLKVFHSVFENVRVLDRNCTGYRVVDEKGEIGEHFTPCYELWGREDRCANCISMKVLKDKGTAQKFEVMENDVCLVVSRYLVVDDKPCIVEMFTRVGNDTIHGFQHNPTFIEAINNVNDELYRDIQLDVYNRRYYEEQLCSREDITAVAMLDLDNFKGVNDTYGHAAGDKVLSSVAAAIRGTVRKDDAVIRYGGDEMLIAFSNMKREYLRARLEDIRAAVEGCRFADHHDLRITATIGACFCGELSDDSVDRADKQLYLAKRVKNCVCVDGVDD